jgi:hypothetical protein
MIFEKFESLDNDRIVKSLIGISKDRFNQLLVVFKMVSLTMQQERYENGEIKRIQSGGNKSCIDTYEKQLFFVLYYLKTYETFDVLGFHFGCSGGNAHEHIKRLLPILERSLKVLNVLPERPPESVDDFIKLIEKYKDIIIDGVESACVRPQEETKQKARYSGKKKRHTLKALVVSDFARKILIISCIVAGSIHDYALMKKLFYSDKKWFNNINLWLDLGFYGADNEYEGNIYLPHKKPKKTKKNPNTQLTSAQKKENKAHAKIRVIVEHAIGGMKTFYCLTHRIRNHIDTMIDSFFLLSAGLWNLKIS